MMFSGTCKESCAAQVMYPWRRVFRSLFAHDRSRGTQYTLREKDAKGRPMQVSCLSSLLTYLPILGWVFRKRPYMQPFDLVSQQGTAAAQLIPSTRGCAMIARNLRIASDIDGKIM